MFLILVALYVIFDTHRSNLPSLSYNDIVGGKNIDYFWSGGGGCSLSTNNNGTINDGDSDSGSEYDEDKFLPIVPTKMPGASHSTSLQHFFEKYPSHHQPGGGGGGGGWIDVNRLSIEDIQDLRKTAIDISGMNTMCGHPQPVMAGSDNENEQDAPSLSSTATPADLEYCF